jgi:hypothetical protein
MGRITLGWNMQTSKKTTQREGPPNNMELGEDEVVINKISPTKSLKEAVTMCNDPLKRPATDQTNHPIDEGLTVRALTMATRVQHPATAYGMAAMTHETRA